MGPDFPEPAGADGLAAGKKLEARMEFLRSTPAERGIPRVAENESENLSSTTRRVLGYLRGTPKADRISTATFCSLTGQKKSENQFQAQLNLAHCRGRGGNSPCTGI